MEKVESHFVVELFVYLGRPHVCDRTITAVSLAICCRNLFGVYLDLLGDKTHIIVEHVFLRI